MPAVVQVGAAPAAAPTAPSKAANTFRSASFMFTTSWPWDRIPILSVGSTGSESYPTILLLADVKIGDEQHHGFVGRSPGQGAQYERKAAAPTVHVTCHAHYLGAGGCNLDPKYGLAS